MRFDLEEPYRSDLVVGELQTHGVIVRRIVHIDDRSADGELTGLLDDRGRLVPEEHEPAAEVVEIETRPQGELDDVFPENFRGERLFEITEQTRDDDVGTAAEQLIETRVTSAPNRGVFPELEPPGEDVSLGEELDTARRDRLKIGEGVPRSFLVRTDDDGRPVERSAERLHDKHRRRTAKTRYIGARETRGDPACDGADRFVTANAADQGLGPRFSIISPGFRHRELSVRPRFASGAKQSALVPAPSEAYHALRPRIASAASAAAARSRKNA